MKLYHGTTSRLLTRVKRDGLVPRGKRNGNWKHTVDSNPNAVYLTVAYSLYYALCATKSEPGLILEIDSNKLNPFRLTPDEDFAEQATRNAKQYEHIHALNKKEQWGATKHFRDNLETYWGGTEAWKASLKGLGNCCYFGTVPPEAITRYAILPDMASYIKHSDPTITIMNFAVMGDYYKALSALVFGDDIGYVNPEPFTMPDGRAVNGFGTLPPRELAFKDVEIHAMEVRGSGYKRLTENKKFASVHEDTIRLQREAIDRVKKERQ